MLTPNFSSDAARDQNGASWLRATRSFAVALLVACLAACGGGGSSSGSSSTASTSGGTSGPSQQPIAANASNTVPVTVNAGLTGQLPNIPTVSVTVCVSGTSNCATVNNVQVDTASFGLRVLASALPSSFAGALPISTASSGGTLAECTAFADGYTWGSIRTADVKLGGETATNLPIQVIGDLASSSTPQACANYGDPQNTVQDLGANGILGIGVAPSDCGTNCTKVSGSNYFACPNSTNCTVTAVSVAQQVANPVPHFATDNNGVILQMAPVSNSGASSATGTLVFGIGTQSNNALAAATVLPTDSWGNVAASFNSRSLTGFLDSGSNGLFFTDNALAQCGGNLGTFFCPSTTQSFSAALTAADGTKGTATFNVANAQSLLGSGNNYAANNLAGQFGSASNLDLGLPFFYGRYVYYGMDQTASGGKAPYVAF